MTVTHTQVPSDCASTQTDGTHSRKGKDHLPLTAKAKVRKVLREYMAKPGATMENDVFDAMVKLLEDERAAAIEDAAEVADKMSDYNKGDSRRRYALSNLATQIRALKPNEGKG